MKTRSIVTVVLLAAASTPLMGQSPASKNDLGAYLVPFDTDRNQIELAVANTTPEDYAKVEVRIKESPAWLTMEPAMVMLEEIGPEEEAFASFTFSTDDSAPTEEVHALVFAIFSGDELIATKQIDILVELPKELVLRGNYPNPFNPSTTIGFVQPEDGDVELEIFDSIGRRIDLLSRTDAKRGQQTFQWNAASYATGVYFYRLELVTKSSELQTKLGKMMLIK